MEDWDYGEGVLRVEINKLLDKGKREAAVDFAVEMYKAQAKASKHLLNILAKDAPVDSTALYNARKSK